MTLTYDQAKNEIQKVLYDAWNTTGYQIHFEEVYKERSANKDPWAVSQMRHYSGRQTTLCNADGEKRFTRQGVLTVQIFVPGGKGLSTAYNLGKVVSDAFEGVSNSSGVWFRSVRIREVGRDGEFFQLNVIVDFQYDEIK